MRILVAGSEGSLMQATIPLLLQGGHEVRGVDSYFRYGKVERLRSYEFVEGDLSDPALAARVCEHVDLIVQAAARIFGVVGFHKFPADILSKDVVLHQNLLWEALRNGVRKVVYISSSMVYERSCKVPLEEDDVDEMAVPLTDYGLSKLVGERLCRAFHKQYGLTYTIWRPFNIITPFEKGESEPGIAHVFADLFKRIVIDRSMPVEIIGDGKQTRCFTWIGDVARGIGNHVLDQATDCQAFNLGNPEPVSILELARRIYDLAVESSLVTSGQLAFVHRPAFPDDVRVRIPSIERARSLLGWEPSVKLNDALRRCLDNVAGLPAS